MLAVTSPSVIVKLCFWYLFNIIHHPQWFYRIWVPLWQEEEGHTMLQLEKDIRTRVEVMMKQKSQRMQELKALCVQDQELCDILCTDSYSIGPDSVPSLKELENFRQHIVNLTSEKVNLPHICKNKSNQIH